MCHHEVKCHKVFWLQVYEAVWSNWEQPWSSITRIFLCEECELLLCFLYCSAAINLNSNLFHIQSHVDGFRLASPFAVHHTAVKNEATRWSNYQPPDFMRTQCCIQDFKTEGPSGRCFQQLDAMTLSKYITADFMHWNWRKCDPQLWNTYLINFSFNNPCWTFSRYAGKARTTKWKQKRQKMPLQSSFFTLAIIICHIADEIKLPVCKKLLIAHITTWQGT